MTKFLARSALTAFALMLPVASYAAADHPTTAPSHKKIAKKHHQPSQIKKQAPTTTAPSKAPPRAPVQKPPATK